MICNILKIQVLLTVIIGLAFILINNVDSYPANNRFNNRTDRRGNNQQRVAQQRLRNLAEVSS